MNEISFEQMGNTQGGKFWGSEWECSGCQSGFMVCTETHFRLWFDVGTDTFISFCGYN